jgi:hypothetical protein
MSSVDFEQGLAFPTVLPGPARVVGAGSETR